MTRTMRGIVAATLLAGTSAAALGQGLGWRVSETAGPVTIRHGTTMRPAQRGAALEAGDAVQTGAGGRAVLVRAKDFVTVSANSRVSVPVAEQATGFVKIVQDLGNAIFKIEKLGVPHFGVNTPYLAAVVKGTTFSVTVDPAGTSLQVVEGAVEVATLDGGARDLVRPGDVATIGAGDLYRLRVQGDTERTVDSPARPPEPAAASGGSASTDSATPVIAVASPEPVAPPVAGAEVSVIAQAIGEGVSSKPVDLAAATGGMILGTTGGAALIATVRATETATMPTVAVPDAAPVAETPVAAPTAPAATAPAATAPGPEITAPATTAPATTAPTPAVPSVAPPETVPSAVTTPAVTPPATAAPTSPAPETPAPVAITPIATTPAITVPAVTTPVVTAPVVTAPVVTAPVATAPVVTAPAVTTPLVTAPVVTAPVVTTPVVTAPVVTAPVVTAPVVTAPPVAAPVVTAPVVTPPAITPGTLIDTVRDILDKVGNRGRGNDDNPNRGRGNAFGLGR